MEAEELMTYEKWYESQCDIGYDVCEGWIEQECDHALADIMHKAGMPECLWRKCSGRFINWSVGGYDDYVTFDMGVELHKIPKDHSLRQRFPFAFLAQDKEFTHSHSVLYYRSTRSPNSLSPEYLWDYQGYVHANNDTPFSEGSIYDGMEWGLVAELMEDQTDGLMEVLTQYADDICHLALCSLRADYDWFYSEERYKEEMGL